MQTKVTLFALSMALSGCIFRPEIKAASVTKLKQGNGEDYALIKVRLDQKDAQKIKTWEVHVSIVLVNCDGPPNEFPTRPQIDGQPVDNFDTPLQKGDVVLSAKVPRKIMSEYAAPCIFLRGGSYLGARISSERTALVWKP